MARWRPDGFTWLLLGLSLGGGGGGGLVLLREATYGAVLSRDSVSYIAAARSLLAGEGFVNFLGAPYVYWPPLYSLLLAAASLFTFDPREVAGPVNAAVFGLTVFIAGRYLRQCLESGFLALWGSCAIALSLPLAEVAAWTLSDPLFILLVTLALIATDRLLGADRGAVLVGVAALTVLVCLTRYMAITLVGAVALLLLLQPGAALPEKLRRIGAYSLLSLAPVALWLLRNFLLVGQPTGNREGNTNYTPGEILAGMQLVAERWLFLDLLPEVARIILAPLAGSALLALAAGVVYVSSVAPRKASGHSRHSNWRPFCIAGVFALVYIAGLSVALLAGTVNHGVQAR